MRKNLRLIEARKKKGLTQEQLARQLNRKKTTISNWENGYCNPKLSDAFKVAELLETDVSELFFDDKVQETHT
ncbi:helix-turn-helix transcriptional regulator [Thermaerobacillus caldiproteolyticus]|uniref:helix-turn-helix transcriptional regulator n=1 Tax=Thermaerobacillus caldiproteolyticus TaxID=247480 RepID=UPI0018F118EC|nr:helix-turn-helix transcriptional regulator [Anoxybacillus caldiproteolyticus]